ncbi:unnamed protein product [Ilex paraguariensis]
MSSLFCGISIWTSKENKISSYISFIRLFDGLAYVFLIKSLIVKLDELIQNIGLQCSGLHEDYVNIVQFSKYKSHALV